MNRKEQTKKITTEKNQSDKYYDAGVAAIKSNSYKEAEEAFKKAFDINNSILDKHWDVWKIHQNTLHTDRKYEYWKNIIRYNDNIIEVNKNNIAVLSNLIEIAKLQGYSESIEEAQEFIKEAKCSIAWRFNDTGLIHLINLKDYEKAEVALKQAVEWEVSRSNSSYAKDLKHLQQEYKESKGSIKDGK